MEHMHAVYQALKSTVDVLYTDIRSFRQERDVNDVREALDGALKALEDKLGITGAVQEGLERKSIEDIPPPPPRPVEPSRVTESPATIAARVTDEAIARATLAKISNQDDSVTRNKMAEKPYL